MNLQFSLSATASSGTTSYETVSSKIIVNNHLEPKKSAGDMSVQERQGVNVSIAEEQLIKSIERAVKSLQGPQTTLEISIHEKTHDIMVKVMNKDTGELIREVPPEKTLDLVAKMMEIAGILVDEKI
ncbi:MULTISPECIES: flagellar protein FlaG [Paenibacillus]|uniref:Flagellar protein FlaG n=1 Tax=Paenibacillus pabuli TaxID=1472 RepID=A0A855Y771_9BACL|nr:MULTISPECIES: flagellar protein FlaG [Paenibacillus]PWW37451.1 flagellar protein FlaG [Paenibacillus pabuli]PXW05593.1 flagellar protein FlaG [Paenibacillus taichungensis]RAI98871.1 flagellar protein FlaG [Paenibacillus pabuli]